MNHLLKIFGLLAFVLIALGSETTNSGTQQNAGPQQMHKAGASYQTFLQERYDCIQQASRPVSGSYVNAYGGSSSSTVMPSQGIYYSCMNAKGWYIVSNGGYLPQTPVRMTP